MIDIIEEFIGQFPSLTSIYEFGIFLEYTFAGCMLLLISLSIYCIFGTIIRLFRR